MRKIIQRYVPSFLTKQDKKKQIRSLQKSRKLYKKGIYYTRKPVKSFHRKTSKYILHLFTFQTPSFHDKKI